jgi:hypothetical protein
MKNIFYALIIGTTLRQLVNLAGYNDEITQTMYWVHSLFCNNFLHQFNGSR